MGIFDNFKKKDNNAPLYLYSEKDGREIVITKEILNSGEIYQETYSVLISIILLITILKTVFFI